MLSYFNTSWRLYAYMMYFIELNLAFSAIHGGFYPDDWSQDRLLP